MPEKTNSAPQEILSVVKSAKNVLLIMDSRFDFDALCSTLAFSDFLKQLSVKHTCIFGYDIPTKVKGRFDTSRITENVNVQTYNYAPHDLIVFLDSGTVGHLVKTHDYVPPANIPSINIDHHAGNPHYGTYNYVKETTSTSSALFDLFRAWHVDITKAMANYLLAAIVTDSGLLQYSSTNQVELQKVIDLMNLGADYHGFMRYLTQNEAYEDMVVKGIIYANLVFDRQNKFAYSVLNQADIDKKQIKEFSVVPADVIKKLADTDFVFVIRTDPGTPGSWYISLRSHNPEFDVLHIAQQLGGGGHKVAAGCSISFTQAQTADEAVKVIIDLAKHT